MRALHDVVVSRVLCVVILLLPWVTGGIRTSVGGASLASDKKDDGSPGARDPRWWWSTALAAPRISPDVGAITRHVCGPRMDASCVRPACCIHNPTRVCESMDEATLMTSRGETLAEKKSFLDVQWPYFPRECRSGGANFSAVEFGGGSSGHRALYPLFDGLGMYGDQVLTVVKSRLAKARATQGCFNRTST